MCLEVYQVDGVTWKMWVSTSGIYDHNHFVIKVWQIHLQFIKGADMSINNYLVIMLTIANAVIWTWALMEIL